MAPDPDEAAEHRPPLLDPFERVADPADYFPLESTEAVLAAALAAVREPSGRVALIGGASVGKTLLLRVLLGRLGNEFETAWVGAASLTPDDLCEWVANRFGGERTDDPARDFESVIARCRAQGRGLVLAIDGAEDLSRSTARFVARRVVASGGALRVALAATSGEAASDAIDAIGGRVRVMEIDGDWTESEARAFLTDRLERSAAPAGLRQRFDAAVVRELLRASNGSPADLLRSAAAWLAQAAEPTGVSGDTETFESELPSAAAEGRDPQEGTAPGTELVAPGPLGKRGDDVRSAQRRLSAGPAPHTVIWAAAIVVGLLVAIPVVRSLVRNEAENVASVATVSAGASAIAGEEARGAAEGEEVRLPPPSGDLGPFGVHVNATPWAEISVDGVSFGQTPLSNIPLLAGAHRFEARMPDGRVLEREIQISADNRHIAFE